MTIQEAINARSAEVANAYAKLARAEKEAHREKKPVPKQLRERLRTDITLAERNLESAYISQAAMSRFPPCRC